MKKLILIYNPNSGNKEFKFELDKCIKIFQDGGYNVCVYRSSEKTDAYNFFSSIKVNDISAFVICGGDGTINTVLNYIMNYKLNNIPIGFIPCGTANDFSTFLRLPKRIEDACKIILQNNIANVDVGIANDKYFINVCAGGLFANVGSKINKDFKETFGKLAYYIKAIEEVHHFNPIRLRIKNTKDIFEDDFSLFLVLNSSGTGGIKKISPTASISDGMFDFVAFKNVSFSKIPSLATKFLKGEYLEDDKVLFFRDKEIYIENLSEEIINTDLDGEIGPTLPVKINNIKNSLKMFYNDKI